MSNSDLVVEALFRYPVKSMQGEAQDALAFAGGQVEGDRQWALVDTAQSVVLSGKRHEVMLQASARVEAGGSVVVSLPDGGEHVAGEPATDAALSEWLGRPIEMRRPGASVRGYESLADALDETSEVTVWPTPPTHFADLAACHLLTTASLRAGRSLHPEGDWDVRRFRPTILVGGGDAKWSGFVEDSWVGSSVRAGEVPLSVFMQTPRCSLPPRAQPRLPRDPTVGRVLRQGHDLCLGVYAACSQDGAVRVGDELTVGGAGG